MKATIAALAVAIVVLITVILPAEYNIDPTGIGKATGLSAFSQTDESANQSSTDVKQTANNQDRVILTVPAGRGIEYKLAMEQFAKANYEWETIDGSLYVDLHGEPAGDTTGYFESYTIATVSQMKGSFTAPFAGSHGWYWKNTSDKDIQLQLIFDGDYAIEGLKQ